MRKNLYSNQVTYVKVKDYVKSFLKVEYDGFPLVVDKSENPKLFRFIRDLVVDNKDVVKIAEGRSLNQVAFDYSRNGKIALKEHANAYVVEKEDLSMFLPVLLPAGIRNGNAEPSPYTQLSSKGCREFRDAVDELFWDAMAEFMARGMKKDETATIGGLIEDFAIKYDISTRHLDNLERSYRRNMRNYNLEARHAQSVKLCENL